MRTVEAQLLTEALDDCFGWELLQLGAWGEGRELVSGARTRAATIVAGASLRSADIVARLGRTDRLLFLKKPFDPSVAVAAVAKGIGAAEGFTI